MKIANEGIDLSDDIKDKDLSRIAKYVSKKTDIPPELGTVGYFIRVASSSKKRAETSNLIKAFYSLTLDWRNSRWLLKSDGLLKSLTDLTKNYRNKAAHTTELTEDDYSSCKELLLGDNGALWNLILATSSQNFKF